MPVSNGRFSKPIRLKEDLANFFGLSANLGNIIKNANINMWSKKKPIISSKVSELTDEDRKAAAYGLYFDPNSSVRIEWKYKRPTGGSSSWFRALDFNGYDHYMKSGLQFTSENYSKDIVKSSSGLEVALYTDPEMITVKDFSETLLKGCKIRIKLIPYDGQSTYDYETEYEDINASELKWVIPRSALIGLNVGRSTVNAEITRPDGSRFPNILVKDNTFITITAETGVSVTDWGYSMNVGTSTQNMHPASDYQPGVSKYILDVSNGENIYFSFGGLKNNSGQTITSANVFVQMSYIDADGNNVQKRINLYKGSSLDTFSIPTGSTGADYFGLRHENLPSLPNGTAVMYSVQVNMTFDGINGTYSITDTVRMITKNN